MQKVHKILEHGGVIRIKYKLYKTNKCNAAYSWLRGFNNQAWQGH